MKSTSPRSQFSQNPNLTRWAKSYIISQTTQLRLYITLIYNICT